MTFQGQCQGQEATHYDVLKFDGSNYYNLEIIDKNLIFALTDPMTFQGQGHEVTHYGKF
jgi:hypothetical protein